ncbi:MAG: hypothetical protein M3169_15230 [Candidatus Eremiobacteraeota bacterium]|nr:hypothetical protein [Candidatus Eremiobacteraeota bacterium]
MRRLTGAGSVRDAVLWAARYFERALESDPTFALTRHFLDRTTHRRASRASSCARMRSWGWASGPTRSRASRGRREYELWTVLLPLSRIFYDLRTDQSFRALVPVAVAR